MYSLMYDGWIGLNHKLIYESKFQDTSRSAGDTKICFCTGQGVQPTDKI